MHHEIILNYILKNVRKPEIWAKRMHNPEIHANSVQNPDICAKSLHITFFRTQLQKPRPIKAERVRVKMRKKSEVLHLIWPSKHKQNRGNRMAFNCACSSRATNEHYC